MTQQALTLALERCKLQNPFEIEYYDSSDCYVVILHEPVLMNWSIERIMMLGGFLSLASGSEREIHLIFEAQKDL